MPDNPSKQPYEVSANKIGQWYYDFERTDNEPSELKEQRARLAVVPGAPPARSKLGEPGWMNLLRQRETDLWARVRVHGDQRRAHLSGNATYILGDAINWLSDLPPNSIHAIVTDPPYGLLEYEEKDDSKLRSGKGGVWRIPPFF